MAGRACLSAKTVVFFEVAKKSHDKRLREALHMGFVSCSLKVFSDQLIYCMSVLFTLSFVVLVE